MRRDRAALACFHEIRTPGERFYWVGGPAFVPLVVRGVPLLLFGLAWALFDITFFGLTASTDPFLIVFFAIHMAPCWIGVLNFIRLILVHKNTFYAVTNQRVILRSGFWGIDVKVYDYDKLSDIEVNINPIEHLYGCGTIRLHAGRGDERRTPGFQFLKTNEHMYAIANPTYVFRNLKQISLDTKTDWYYPNALRPETNPGHQSTYTGGAFPDGEMPELPQSGPGGTR